MIKLYTASITEKSNIADLIQSNKELERDLILDFTESNPFGLY